MSDARATFDRLTGGGEEPHEYQLEVAAAVLAGENVVVRAPTGGGKTLAALLGPLHAWCEGTPIVDRVLYALPLRALATSLAGTTRAFVGRLGIELATTLQMGGDENDPLYDRGHLVFTTIDQLLSRYLNVPFSLGFGRANIPPGALIGSLVVLDEVHLLDPAGSLATACYALGRHLRDLAQVVVMSATLTTAALEELRRLLNARLILVDPASAQRWQAFQGRERRIRAVPSIITGPALAQDLRARAPRRVLVICNTVDRAQRLRRELEADLFERYDVQLLHSRFLATDRRQIEASVLRGLGRVSGGSADGRRGCLAVATQVVEVGLDISCDELHTELAPAASLIQRLGRCARWRGERGQAYVYDLERTERGVRRLGPYRDEGAAVDRTWDWLISRDGSPLRLEDEEEWVESAHDEEDRSRFSAACDDSVARRVAETIDDAEIGRRRELIRSIDSISVFVGDAPESVVLERRPELVGVPRVAIRALLTRSGPVEVHAYRIGEDAEGVPTIGGWAGVQMGPEDIAGEFALLLPTALASYDSRLGLRLGVPGEAMPVCEWPRPKCERFKYTREPYSAHVERALERARAILDGDWTAHEEPGLRPGVRRGVARLARRLAVSEQAIDTICRLAVALHDAGKLGKRWQAWAERWQSAVEPGWSPGLLAHTTYDPDNMAHRDLERSFRAERIRRPPHAVSGALASADIIAAGIEELLSDASEITRCNVVDAVLSAIARHHSPLASNAEPFEPDPRAQAAVARTFARAGIPCKDAIHALRQLDLLEASRFVVRLSVVDERGGQEGAELAVALYWLIVRVVRLADNHAVALSRAEGEVHKP